MNTNIFAENKTNKPFILDNDRIVNYATAMFNFIINNNFSEFNTNNDYDFEITVCDNDFIQRINRDYRKKDKPTDVITFALFTDSNEKIIVDNVINLGQIIISADKVKEQSTENNVTEEYEFLNLLAHGILHLLGFDHADDITLVNMFDLQNRMLEVVNNVKI